MRSRPLAALLVVATAATLSLAACGTGGLASLDGPSLAADSALAVEDGASGGSEPAAGADEGTPDAAGGDVRMSVDDRPFTLHEPPGYDPVEPTSLVVALHGYPSTAAELDDYLGLTAASDDRGFLLALPEGLEDRDGGRYWNAIDGGCCDLDDVGTDDSAWLSLVLDSLTTTFRVDRVVVVGHSAGGYMAHRLACDHADQVDAIASLAGPLPLDTSLCEPAGPVTVLQIQGDADPVVGYAGADDGASAPTTAATWARLDGCAPTPSNGPTLDLDAGLAGAETTVEVWRSGCDTGTQVQLWTIHGGQHTPDLTPAFTDTVLDVLLGTES
jgi:polyhydroxybutyrate depolymerase